MRSLPTAVLVAVMVIGGPGVVCQQSRNWAGAVERLAQTSPQARAVVLDVGSGRILAARHFEELARTLAAPGSTLKPILLYQSLQSRLWNPDRRVPCQRSLMIRGHRLVCSHPMAPAFTAREALAWSCNTYFAELARSLPPGGLERAMRPTGLFDRTGLAEHEAVAEFRLAQNTADAELEALGVEGIRVTPLELAVAYRWLAMRMMGDPDSPASETVMGGLTDSASFGIAGPAHLGGVPVAGKTGTAESAGGGQTNGWFAGLAPASRPEVVVVVYLPAGRGANAAQAAGTILGNSPLVGR